MITIKDNYVENKKEELTVQEVCDISSPSKNVFIGKCGVGPASALYLVTYNSIILLNNPKLLWPIALNDETKVVKIDRWVDITITVTGECEE